MPPVSAGGAGRSMLGAVARRRRRARARPARGRRGPPSGRHARIDTSTTRPTPRWPRGGSTRSSPRPSSATGRARPPPTSRRSRAAGRAVGRRGRQRRPPGRGLRGRPRDHRPHQGRGADLEEGRRGPGAGQAPPARAPPPGRLADRRCRPRRRGSSTDRACRRGRQGRGRGARRLARRPLSPAALRDRPSRAGAAIEVRRLGDDELLGEGDVLDRGRGAMARPTTCSCGSTRLERGERRARRRPRAGRVSRRRRWIARRSRSSAGTWPRAPPPGRRGPQQRRARGAVRAARGRPRRAARRGRHVHIDFANAERSDPLAPGEPREHVVQHAFGHPADGLQVGAGNQGAQMIGRSAGRSSGRGRAGPAARRARTAADQLGGDPPARADHAVDEQLEQQRVVGDCSSAAAGCARRGRDAI